MPRTEIFEIFSTTKLTASKSCVQFALRPSYFDLEDFRPGTTHLFNRNCAVVFKDTKTPEQKEDQLLHALRQLHKNLKCIGIVSQFPKQSRLQHDMARDILAGNPESEIQECCSHIFEKIRALQAIAQALWATRLDNT